MVAFQNKKQKTSGDAAAVTAIPDMIVSSGPSNPTSMLTLASVKAPSFKDRVQKFVTIDVFSDDMKAVEDALDLIADKCLGDVAASKLVYDLDGHVAILKALTKWKDEYVIQSEGCRALNNACCNYEAMTDKAVKLGAFETVIAAMVTFHDYEQLQYSGCCALDTLSSGCLARTRILFQKHNGARVFVAAMEEFPRDVNIQQMCCWSFMNTSAWKDLVEPILETDAFSACTLPFAITRIMPQSSRMLLVQRSVFQRRITLV
jgi:hypothetical protein